MLLFEVFVGKMTSVDAANASSIPLHTNTKNPSQTSAVAQQETVRAFNQQRETEQLCGDFRITVEFDKPACTSNKKKASPLISPFLTVRRSYSQCLSRSTSCIIQNVFLKVQTWCMAFMQILMADGFTKGYLKVEVIGLIFI